MYMYLHVNLMFLKAMFWYIFVIVISVLVIQTEIILEFVLLLSCTSALWLTRLVQSTQSLILWLLQYTSNIANKLYNCMFPVIWRACWIWQTAISCLNTRLLSANVNKRWIHRAFSSKHTAWAAAEKGLLEMFLHQQLLLKWLKHLV